jgi:hypothetical protein
MATPPLYRLQELGEADDMGALRNDSSTNFIDSRQTVVAASSSNTSSSSYRRDRKDSDTSADSQLGNDIMAVDEGGGDNNAGGDQQGRRSHRSNNNDNTTATDIVRNQDYSDPYGSSFGLSTSASSSAVSHRGSVKLAAWAACSLEQSQRAVRAMIRQFSGIRVLVQAVQYRRSVQHMASIRLCAIQVQYRHDFAHFWPFYRSVECCSSAIVVSQLLLFVCIYL